ncbi:PoNe immunity protein domain-containing protein [Pseudomonas sp. NPDC087614]|uniref:PoNe immunity protein domain-containing protein n=1 Tax=Pseudomonas sp. NPDC087614 TaxID=3364442 RepID=UPI00382E93A1
MHRRQQYLSENRYQNFFKNKEKTTAFFEKNTFQADSEDQEKSLRARHFQKLIFKEILIRYTAGDEINNLIPLMESLINSYELLQKKLAVYEGIPNITPLTIDDWLDQYEECVQVFSLCILLHRSDLLKRFVSLIDPAGYGGNDTLYEDLLCKILPDRYDVDRWYHDVYTPLVLAIYVEDKHEASNLLKKYCESWYPAFEQAPWHDSHKQGDEGSYCGYWALEAGAVAFLYGIDDRNIDHMVYPKELVEYARNHQVSNKSQTARIDADQPCSKTGFWFTPAEADSRRYFNQGEIMPKNEGSNCGDTIRYRSGEE